MYEKHGFNKEIKIIVDHPKLLYEDDKVLMATYEEH